MICTPRLLPKNHAIPFTLITGLALFLKPLLYNLWLLLFRIA